MAELKAYLGFVVLEGVVKLPSMYDYWQSSEIFHYSPIASRISRYSFCDITNTFILLTTHCCHLQLLKGMQS